MNSTNSSYNNSVNTGIVRFGSSNSSNNNVEGPTTTNANANANTITGMNMILVKYYLDRPGYDITNSSSRLWKDAPTVIHPIDIQNFLIQQQIIPSNSITTSTTTNNNNNDTSDTTTTATTKASENSNPLLVELYIPHPYNTFMLLDICNENNIVIDFTPQSTTPSTTTSISGGIGSSPGVINIRLTDIHEILLKQLQFDGTDPVANATTAGQPPSQSQSQQTQQQQPQRCNTSPVGLFAFAMTVGLDALYVLQTELLPSLNNDILSYKFNLIYSTYAFYISGLLQFIVGLNEITRNNIYGATAFLGFGCFWLANGTTLILTTYFPEQISDSITSSYGNTAIATFVREMYIMLFACALFKQTLMMNKLTTGLLGTLIVYLLAAALGGFHVAFLWIKMILGFVLSFYGLFLFYAELTNEVYHSTVINLYPWYDHSSDEAFGTAGRTNTLQQYHRKSTTETAIDLRMAGHSEILHQASQSLYKTTVQQPTTTHNNNNIHTATPTSLTSIQEQDGTNNATTTTSYHLRGVRPDK